MGIIEGPSHYYYSILFVFFVFYPPRLPCPRPRGNARKRQRGFAHFRAG
ncbi:hypothetical protein OOU_Y34scaffold00927g25 [Pyricularia oryzae Y34]|uniref:Uncharacterized protein n=2 Tax=Pyricularia oryzae TaxID=318829 RepID=A0AA97NNU4_PYRO3|nr:hypothetical protein OOU_Y34scaffold00927g25 [Pyricularia oryzae Y34]